MSFGNGDPSDVNYLKVLKHPRDFVVEGSNSNNPLIKQELKCEASNADIIYWEYKKLEEDPWSRTLPTPMQVGKPVISMGGKHISLTIDDGDTFLLAELNKLNGYYRCNVEQAGKRYKVQAPPVRIVIPCKFNNFLRFCYSFI